MTPMPLRPGAHLTTPLLPAHVTAAAIADRLSASREASKPAGAEYLGEFTVTVPACIDSSEALRFWLSLPPACREWFAFTAWPAVLDHADRHPGAPAAEFKAIFTAALPADWRTWFAEGGA